LLGVRPELLWQPSKSDVGLGGYLEAWSNFDDLVIGAGASVPLPVGILPSAGAYVRDARLWGVEPGVTVGALFGGWSYGHTGPTSFDLTGSLGVRVDGRLGLGDGQERAVFIALQLDVRYLLIVPVLLLE